jgi:protein-tyrosine phosphatase
MFYTIKYSMDKIVDNLYQGGMPPPSCDLKDIGVQVLVLAAQEHQDASAYEGIEVILAPGDDDTRRHRLNRFIDGWKAAALQVVEHVRAGRCVLVTCMAGHNRSGLIVALALRELTGWSGKKCVERIRNCRYYALNNETFVNYIYKCYPNDK